MGIGVQKAATKRWFALIVDHPDARGPLTRAKELHAFEHTGLEGPSPTQIENYRREFAQPAQYVAGEWTPRYQYDPWAVPQLCGAFPQVKLLTILRNPIDRMVSGITHHGHRHGAPTASVLTEAFARGLYGQQLEPIVGLVPASRLLVLQYEQILDDPSGALRATYEFLDLDPAFVPDSLDAVVGAARVAKFAMSVRAREMYSELYGSDRRRLAALGLDLDLSRWT